MRKLFMAILALAGASSMFEPVRVYANDGIVMETVPEKRVTRAARLKTADGSDPDTVWVGHVDDAAFTAGGKMTAGGYGPYHVGRGPAFHVRSGTPTTIGSNGTWSFDRFQAGETDSLFGWWPIRRRYASTGGLTLDDTQRPWWCLDYGNQANYAINQGAPKRTFGVVGVWHRDRGNTVVYTAADTLASYFSSLKNANPAVAGNDPSNLRSINVQPVQWSPTELGGAGSTASAWMGVRSHGDLSHVDDTANGGTGNPFNSALFNYQGNNGDNQVGSTTANGTDHNFPGYGSQMDQMLYRDVNLAEGDGLTISFNFSTNMSTSKITATQRQIGWFDKDPISPAQTGAFGSPTLDGNFISSSAQTGPVDSFMVYIGAPVNDANVTFSAPLIVNGSPVTTVYDPKRRWFSEVIRCVEGGGSLYKELMSVAGVNAAQGVSINVGSLYPTVLQAIKDANGAGSGGPVRIVFRVKTNRGFDDENGASTTTGPFSSGTRGAAIVDNVVVNGWAASNGDFEATNSINNDTSVLATAAWKSTGKPPAVYWHVHSVLPGQGLVFNDPCGGLDNPNRQCNMYGKVILPGDHDNSEKNGGAFGGNTQDRQKWIVSPTINLTTTGNGPGNYNAMGIDDEIARVTGDYNILFSIYNAGFVNATTQTGNFFSYGWQSFPARQANGNVKWGESKASPSIFFYGVRACFEGLGLAAKANGLIGTINAANTPDSIKIYMQQLSRCFTFGAITEATCSPTIGDNVGTYWDNVSMGFIDGAAPPAISISIWDLLNDAFPMNSTVALTGEAFDTTGAQIRVGINRAGQTGNTSRPVVSGDSVLLTVSGSSHRVDMLFRIKPGPGNYVSTGRMSSGIARTPQGKVRALPGDGSFFGTYMSRNGYFGSGTPGGGDPAGGPGHTTIASGDGQVTWDHHKWNSARCDTAENNLFPTSVQSGGLAAGLYAGMYHEGSPTGNAGAPDVDNLRFSNSGHAAGFNPPRGRCFMSPNPAGPVNSTNIVCVNPGDALPAATPAYDPGTSTSTFEYKKIIPDGLLTPGSHVQYFFRRSDVNITSAFDLAPDTMQIFQASEGNTDGHRWQQFGVLPDRWKDGLWAINERDAPSPACMLFIDWEDRRGDELFWVGFADSIGATVGSRNGSGHPQGRFGAHNGWSARGDQDNSVLIGTDPTIAVYAHGGQPGTIWDMYGVKASESSTTGSSFGSRSAAAPTGLMAGKQDRRGPTGDMLRQFYRILFAVTGDLNQGNIGPYVDKGDNDVGLLQDFANDANPGTATPRAVWFMGRGFVEGQILGGVAGHPTFPPTFFGAGLASGDYRAFAANTNDIPDLIPNPAAGVVTNGSIYGVLSSCVIQNDVLTTQGTFGAIMASKYEDSSTNPNPKIASIYAPATAGGTHPHVSLVDGFRIQSLGSRNSLQSLGAIDYFAQVITNLFGGLNCLLSGGAPVGVGDNPNNALVNFLALRSENPFRSGAAKITFGITRKERVELKVYDVTGRLVRTLANREFDAGSHDLFWDGSNDDGQLVSRGVYFYQLRTPTFVSQKKLAVLKN
jgi:hypothetical protein